MENEKDKEIAVAFISDDYYAVNTAVAIMSLRANREKNRRYHIYFIANNVSVDKTAKISSMGENGFQISVIPYSLKEKDSFKKIAHVSQTAVIKFILADILGELDKVLYLDGDVAVQSDLWELFRIPLENMYAAVVRDVIAELQVPSTLEKLKSSLRYYFNSGMMLLNLKKIREDGIRDKLFAYRREGINYFMDQDALNMVFNGNVKYISCEYNYMITVDEQLSDRQLEQECGLDMSKTDAERMFDARIIHMTGPEKPWEIRMPYITNLFMKYYRQTPFAEDHLYHPLKRSKVEKEMYLFPFELVEKGRDIVLWGAGKVGTAFYRQVRSSRYCKIKKWVDECYLSYAEDNRPVTDPETLKPSDADYFVIAVKNETFAIQIMEKMTDKEIRKEQIIWRYPGYAAEEEYMDKTDQGVLEISMNQNNQKTPKGER